MKIVHAIVITKTASKMHSKLTFFLENYLLTLSTTEDPLLMPVKRRETRMATKKEFLCEFWMFFQQK